MGIASASRDIIIQNADLEYEPDDYPNIIADSVRKSG